MDNKSQYEIISNNSRDISTYICISIILILVFIISPIKQYFYTSILGKCLIFLVLGFAIYKNTENTNQLSNTMKSNFFDGNWDTVKTNIVCSYLLSFFIVVLLFSLL